MTSLTVRDDFICVILLTIYVRYFHALTSVMKNCIVGMVNYYKFHAFPDNTEKNTLTEQCIVRI